MTVRILTARALAFAFAMLVPTSAAVAGPMTGVGAAMNDVDLFDGLTVGPTVGSGLAVNDQRADVALSLGFEMVRFERDDPRGKSDGRQWRLRWSGGAEAAWYVRGELLGARLYVDPFAIGPVSLGLSLVALPSLAIRHEYQLGGGPEAAVHLRLGTGAHEPDLEFFARFEATIDRESDGHIGGVAGLRIVFDLGGALDRK